MVHRIYVEKRPGLSPEAGSLLADLRDFLGIRSLAGVRVLNRYDVENIDPQVYERAKTVVFSEPQADVIWDETFPQPRNAHSLLAVEALPGQFDQRADSCAQCIQLMAGVERPRVRHAKVYLLEGRLSQEELDKIRGYLINPVESREASLEKPETLARDYAAPAMVETLTGFTALDEAGLAALLEKLGLAMDLDDLKFLQAYFRDDEGRDPTITEVRVVDTYWSDHCRHTTFSTHLDGADIADPAVTKEWQEYYKSHGVRTLALDCRSGKGLKELVPAVRQELHDLLEKRKARGMESRPIRMMIVGVPNVGKSSLINRLAGGKRVKVEDRPGVTRGKQWVRLESGIELLDMPGVLWPKFDDRQVGERLAYTGAIKDDVYDLEWVAMRFLDLLRQRYPQLLQQRFKVTEQEYEGLEPFDLLELVGKKRGMMLPGGVVNTERAAVTVLDEFRSGKIGRISLERPHAAQEKERQTTEQSGEEDAR